MNRHWWGYAARLRHSRGYGIHSPFAFDLLMNTLTEQYPYYDYTVIDNWSLSASLKKDFKLLLRLVCHLRPATVNAVGCLAEKAIETTLMADASISIAPLPKMFIVTPTHNTSASSIETAMKVLLTGGSVIVFDSPRQADFIHLLTKTMTCGMTFSNGKTLIAVGRRDLPRQHFELIF